MLIKLALRNIFRNRRRSAITMAVIVFGAVGLILFGGYKAVTFRGLRESTIRGRTGHLQLFGLGHSKGSQKPLEHALTDVTAMRARIEKDPRVQSTAAQITLMGLISNGDKSETFVATAVEPEKDRLMRGQTVIEGTPLPDAETDAVTLGKGLAKSMNVKTGDYVTLMSPTVSGSLNAIDVRVAGIFQTGVKELDERAVKMPLAGAQQLLQTSKVEKLLVFLHETETTGAVQAEIEKMKLPVEMKSWSELASFYHQVVMLYNGIFGFLGIIVSAIVVFSVANTIVMSIFERTREIGTLMAVGVTRGRVWRMFFLEGLLTGTLGGFLGVAAGALVAFLINSGDIMLPPPPGYTVGYKLTILLQPPVLIAAFLISVVTSTLSSIIPAFKASRLKVVDALGHI
ncbi:MAG TPA: FtsX-like permease family protein [Thermoanaerobaculia bacterium]|jgi:putative ABC transport system permease protein